MAERALVIVPVASLGTMAVTVQVSSAPEVIEMLVPEMFPVPELAGQDAPATVVAQVHDQVVSWLGLVSSIEAEVVEPGPLFFSFTV